MFSDYDLNQPTTCSGAAKILNAGHSARIIISQPVASNGGLSSIPDQCSLVFKADLFSPKNKLNVR